MEIMFSEAMQKFDELYKNDATIKVSNTNLKRILTLLWRKANANIHGLKSLADHKDTQLQDWGSQMHCYNINLVKN